MAKARKITERIIGIIIIIAVIAGILTLQNKVRKSYKKSETLAIYNAEKDKFIAGCFGDNKQSLPHTDIFIRVLECVHKNSIHAIDDEFWADIKIGRHAFLTKIKSYDCKWRKC